MLRKRGAMLLALSDLLLTQPLWFLLLVGLGLFSICKPTFFLIHWAYVILMRPSKDLINSYGSWALITGSSDGIGRAFAFELAAQGLNLVLVSRSSKKLEQVSCDIKHKFPYIQIKIVELDLSREISYIIGEIERAIATLDVGILINNVGITYPRAMYFHELDEETWMKIVRVNLEATTAVTKVVLQSMLKKKKGAIVNIGSGASVVVPSHPLYAIYAATKAYVVLFTYFTIFNIMLLPLF